MYLHTTSLTLLTGLNCFVPRARPFSLRSAHWQSRLPQLFVDPALAPFPITGLHCWACLQLALPAVHLYPAGPTPFICIHLRWDRIVTRGHINSQDPCHVRTPKLVLGLALGPTSITVCMFATRPYHYTGPCRWYPQPNVCRSNNYCCLPWSLETAPGGPTENSSSPSSHCGSITALAKKHAVVTTVDLSSLGQWEITTPWTRATTNSALGAQYH